MRTKGNNDFTVEHTGGFGAEEGRNVGKGGKI